MAKRRSATVGASDRHPLGSCSTIRKGSPAVCQSSVLIQYEAIGSVSCFWRGHDTQKCFVEEDGALRIFEAAGSFLSIFNYS